ncbi:hypothetical protein DL771_001494 [Monosporascus sp. 5C6A]|nr:hypothetical protein DL771_001494 [Monosporascus sp. 5C6A]
MRSVKASTERFLAAETELNVLFNNAGYIAADGKYVEKTVQGYEKQLGGGADLPRKLWEWSEKQDGKFVLTARRVSM